MNCLAVLGEHYHEEAAPVRLTEKGEAFLTLRMPWIIDDAAEQISEDRSRLLKRHLVLGTVDGCLRTVPLKPRRFGQLSGLMAVGCV